MSNHKYTQADHPITKEEIAALRDADRAYARVAPDGACTLEAIKTLRYHGQQAEVTTDVICGWSIDDYEKDSETSYPDYTTHEWAYNCFGAVWHPTFATVAQHILKPGDLLVLHWIRCSYSDAARVRGVTQDGMELHILRGDPAQGKRKKLVFRLLSELVLPESYEGSRLVRRQLQPKARPAEYSLTV